MRSALILALALGVATPLIATAAPSTAAVDQRDPGAVVEMFFGKMKSGPSIEAYRSIWMGTLMEKKAAQLQVMADQTDSVLRYFGPVTGWELLRSGVSSPHFQERIYVLRTEGGPIFFRFLLFDIGSRWTISKLTFNDDYDKLAVTPNLQ